VRHCIVLKLISQIYRPSFWFFCCVMYILFWFWYIVLFVRINIIIIIIISGGRGKESDNSIRTRVIANDKSLLAWQNGVVVRVLPVSLLYSVKWSIVRRVGLYKVFDIRSCHSLMRKMDREALKRNQGVSATWRTLIPAMVASPNGHAPVNTSSRPIYDSDTGTLGSPYRTSSMPQLY
jgi:hypothetical protein